ncbi:MAG: gluconokinase, GntK/IdnK-type [Pseudomonadota bacterium]
MAAAGVTGKPESGGSNDDARHPAPSVLVVIGVSGSGKTTVASILANRIGWQFEDADWFHPPENIAKMKSGTALTDEDRWPWLHAIAKWIKSNHERGHHGVVACSALKRVYRDLLVGDLGGFVRMIYLEGTPDLISERLCMRHGHFMPSTLLDSQFATLEPPTADEDPITVGIDQHPREIVSAIVSRLQADIGDTLPPGP